MPSLRWVLILMAGVLSGGKTQGIGRCGGGYLGVEVRGGVMILLMRLGGLRPSWICIMLRTSLLKLSTILLS